MKLTIELKKSLYAVFSQFGKILNIIACKTLNCGVKHGLIFFDDVHVPAATSASQADAGFLFYDKPMRRTIFEYYIRRNYRSQRNILSVGKEEEARREGPRSSTKLASCPRPVVLEAPTLPNNILFVQNLPRDATSNAIQALFQQFSGLKEARMTEAKPGIVFVEYGDEMQATVAYQGLQNFRVSPSHATQISYAK